MSLKPEPILLLLVEDEPSDVVIVEDSLENSRSEPFQVANVTSLADAIAHLKQVHTDAVVLDLNLPDSQGLDTLRSILPYAKDTPVLILSGLKNEELAVQALKIGAQDYIVKGEIPTRILENGLRKAIERQQLVKTLIAKEQRIRQIIENNSDGVVVVDREGVIRFSNPAAEKLFGRHTGELVGVPFGFPVVSEDRTEIEIIPSRGGAVTVELQAVDFEWEGMPALLLSLRDITERKQAEKQRNYHARLLKHLNDAVMATDHQFRITAWNRAAEIMYGWSSEEAIGRNISEILSLEFTEEQRTLARENLTKSTAARSEQIHRRKNGETIYVEANTIAILDEHGRLAGYVSVNRDVTERRQAEEQIQLQIQRLKALRAIDVAINSSFELRTIFDIVLQQVASRLGVDASAILLFDSQMRTLEYAASQGFRSSVLRSTKLRLGEGYAGRVVLENRMIHIPNVMEAGGKLSESLRNANEVFREYYGVPLIVKGEIKGVLEIYQRSLKNVNEEWLEFFEMLAGQAAIAIDNAQLFNSLQLSNLELGLAYDSTIEGWSKAMDLRDRETEGHTLRVTDMTLRLAKAMQVNPNEMTHLRRGALLHDMGKLGVPDHILLKDSKLTPEEWVIMRQHPQFAYDMLSVIPYLKPALDIPYCHHEHWDGNGYPRGLKGEEIPLSARIFAVVDVWDAVTSDRPYRGAWSRWQALKHIEEQSGKQFDPQVVKAFLNLVRG